MKDYKTITREKVDADPGAARYMSETHFPVVLTVCFSPFGPKVTLALFLFKFTRTPGAIFMLRLNRKPMKYSSFAACLRFLAFSHLWDNIITVAVLLSTRTTHL